LNYVLLEREDFVGETAYVFRAAGFCMFAKFWAVLPVMNCA
jgi:hypothetical protein